MFGAAELGKLVLQRANLRPQDELIMVQNTRHGGVDAAA